MKKLMILKNIIIAVLICAMLFFIFSAAMIISGRQDLFETGRVLAFAICLTIVNYGCVFVDMVCLLSVFPPMHKRMQPVPGSLLSAAEKMATAIWYGRKKNLFDDMIASRKADTSKSRKIRNFLCEVAYLFIAAALGTVLLINPFICLIGLPSGPVFRLLSRLFFLVSSLLAIVVQHSVERGRYLYAKRQSDSV